MVVRPGFEQRIHQHLLQPRRYQRAGFEQRLEAVTGRQFEQCANAPERRYLQVHHRLEANRYVHGPAKQQRQALVEQPTADRHAALGMVFDKTHRAELGLVDRQTHPGDTDRLAAMGEDDLAGAGQHEGDFIPGRGQGDGEVTLIVHAPHAHALQAPVHATDDNAVGQWRQVGVEVAEQPTELHGEVLAAHIGGAQDDLLAGQHGMHLWRSP